MATKAEVAAAKAAAAEQAKNLAAAKAQETAAQAKLATFGSPADIQFTKAVAPKFSAMSDIAQRIATKAVTRPEVLAAQGLTLDELTAKTAAVQAGATEYATKVTGITGAEQAITAAQALVGQYSTPVDIPKLDEFSSDEGRSVDAIAAISALLSSYGLGDLSAPITEAVQKGYSSDTIQLIMQDPNSKDPLAVAFQTRFPANKARAAAGKSVLSASEYLAAERSYTQVLQSYGVSNLATKDKLNAFITNDVSAAEVADRVGLAIDRVKNADPFVKAALADYYPSLNQTDIVGAVLDPVEGLPALKRKVQIAEIGGAAAMQGLKTGLASTSALSKEFENVTTGALGAEALAAFGITQEEARKGYGTVASIAPRAEFLSSISGGEDYTRLQAEQEAFLGLASAKRARESLTAQEEARFKGQAGLTKTSLTGTGAGQF